MDKQVLSVRNLSVFLNNSKKKILVDKINFQLYKEQTIAFVGDSGAGKTLTAMAICHLLSRKQFTTEGKILYKHEDQMIDTGKFSYEKARKFASQKVGLIFQDAINSLNPHMKVGKQIVETLRFHKKMSKKQAWICAKGWLETVGIHNGNEVMESYPRQLSGGMRQRIAIALVLCYEPEILIADEPTTSLDVMNQAVILELIQKLVQEKKIALLYVTHDLGVVAQTCQHMLVMRNGRLVEQGAVAEIFKTPQTLYTKKLIDRARQKYKI